MAFNQDIKEENYLNIFTLIGASFPLFLFFFFRFSSLRLFSPLIHLGS